MNYLKQFVIPFSGLPEGEHWFDFKIETSFFECFESSDILEANVDLKLQFIKRSTMLELTFNFVGTMQVDCDRCLTPVEIPVESSEKIYIKFSDEEYDDSEEILTIPHGESEVDIGSLVYEMLFVAMPMKRVHEIGQCAEGIEDQISFEEDDDEDDEIDPRWEQLKNL